MNKISKDNEKFCKTNPEFENFREFAKKIVNIPKSEIDDKERKVKAKSKEKAEQNFK